MVLLPWQDGADVPEGVSVVPRPVTENRLVHAIWQVLGWSERDDPLPAPDGSHEIAPTVIPQPEPVVPFVPVEEPDAEPEPGAEVDEEHDAAPEVAVVVDVADLE